MRAHSAQSAHTRQAAWTLETLRFHGTVDSPDNTNATVFGRYPNNTPEALHLLESMNVTSDLKAAAEMMLAFILDPEHPHLPSHIKECERHTVRTEHGDLGLGAWETRLDQPQPNLALLWRLRAAVDEFQHRFQMSQSAHPPVTTGDEGDIVGLEPSALASASSRATVDMMEPRLAMSNAVRSGVVTARPSRIRTSSASSASRRVMMPFGGRALAWTSSTGVSESIHFDPCNAAAASPAIVACRCDQSHAATIRCSRDGRDSRGTYTFGNSAQYRVRS